MRKVYSDSHLDGGAVSARYSYQEPYAFIRRYGVEPDPSKHYYLHTEVPDSDTAFTLAECQFKGYKIEKEVVAGRKYILSCPRHINPQDPDGFSYEGEVSKAQAENAARHNPQPATDDMVASHELGKPIDVSINPEDSA